MELLYKVKENKLFFLDEMWIEKEKQSIDLSIYNKFIKKYWKQILEKEALWLCNLEKIYFLYPYSLGFWYPKTNIAKLIQIAKTWELDYCKKVFNLVKTKTLNFAKQYDAVVFVPYSVERKCNFLILLKNFLKQNNIKVIESFRIKAGNEIKNIKSIKEKYKVAFEKFDIEKNTDFKYKKILIIDDMVNTWASMCAIANKFDSNLKIDAFSIVWSLSNEIVSDI